MDKKVIKIVIISVLLVSLIIQYFSKEKEQNSNKNDSTRGKGWNFLSWFSFRHGKTQSNKQKTLSFDGLFSFMEELYKYMLKLSIVVFIVKQARQLYQGYQNREQQKKVFYQFEQSCLAEPSVYNYQEQEQIIQDLRQNIFVMQVKSMDGQMALSSRLNINTIFRLTNTAFSVGLKESDDGDKCNMNGYLGFTKDGFKIKLVKKLEDQLPTERKDNESLLAFEGFGNASEASGQWLQIGRQNYSKCLGARTWVAQTQYQ